MATTTEFPFRLKNFRHQQDEWDRHRDDDYHYRKKKKRMDIFDIFD